MTSNNTIAAGAVCLLLVGLPACNSTDTAAKSPYPVVDSGVWVDWHGYAAGINWIDNQRILFKTVKDNDKRRVTSGPFNLSVWEVGKGVKPYTDYFQSVTACIQGEMIHRTQENTQGNVRFYGKFGEEKSFDFPTIKGAFFDNMNCRPNDNPEILAKRAQGRAIKPLLDHHGYLDFGPLGGDKNSFVAFHRADGQVVELSLRQQEANHIEYYRFKDAYFIFGHYYDTDNHSGTNVWPKKAAHYRYVWWLHPDGRVEPVKFPDGPWIKETKSGSGYVTYDTLLYPTWLYPTQQGYFLVTGQAKSARNAGTLGAYLLHDGKLIKLIGGHINSPTVSPDGCNIAFVHYPYADATITADPAPITLKVVKLCQNQEEKNHGQQ